MGVKAPLDWGFGMYSPLWVLEMEKGGNKELIARKEDFSGESNCHFEALENVRSKYKEFSHNAQAGGC